VNCKNICNKAFDFRNVIDTYKSDVMGTESWLSEEVINAGVFKANYTTFKGVRHSRVDGVFICEKNYTTLVEMWFDELYEMIAIYVKGRDLKKEKSWAYTEPQRRTCGISKIRRLFGKKYEALNNWM